MNEDELRALVREAVARHLVRGQDAGHEVAAAAAHTPGRNAGGSPHASHAMFLLHATGTACIIEPSVVCTHCGYCKSYGH